MYVYRDILDKQLVDQSECKMGRVDGLVMRIRSGSPPIIESIELGMTRVGERLHRRIGRWIESASLRLGVRRTPRYLIEWSKVKSVDDHHIQVTVDNESEASSDWEWWLRTRIVDRIPGAKPDEEEK
jgi:hypothetical protein